MQKTKDDLIQFQSLQGNIINGLAFLLDNNETMSHRLMCDSIVSIINQLEVNNKYFNNILDKIAADS